jgi:hypothetical protein
LEEQLEAAGRGLSNIVRSGKCGGMGKEGWKGREGTNVEMLLLNLFVNVNKQTNSVTLSPRANYTDRSTTTCRRNLVSTFVDRGVSRGQRGGSPTVVNLSFLDRFVNVTL